MFVLPVVIAPFIITLPAGLAVYWISTNVWTLGQQFVVKRIAPAARRTRRPRRPPRRRRRSRPRPRRARRRSGSSVPEDAVEAERRRAGRRAAGGAGRARRGDRRARPRRARPRRRRRGRRGRREIIAEIEGEDDLGPPDRPPRADDRRAPAALLTAPPSAGARTASGSRSTPPATATAEPRCSSARPSRPPTGRRSAGRPVELEPMTRERAPRRPRPPQGARRRSRPTARATSPSASWSSLRSSPTEPERGLRRRRDATRSTASRGRPRGARSRSSRCSPRTRPRRARCAIPSARGACTSPTRSAGLEFDRAARGARRIADVGSGAGLPGPRARRRASRMRGST